MRLLECFHLVRHVVVIVAEAGNVVERLALVNQRGLHAADHDTSNLCSHLVLGAGVGVTDVAQQFAALNLSAGGTRLRNRPLSGARVQLLDRAINGAGTRALTRR